MSGTLDRVLQAIADPTRRALLEHLGRGPASVSQLAEPLPMSLSAVLQHLHVLEASGLIRSEKIGRVRTYRIAPGALLPAERWIKEATPEPVATGSTRHHPEAALGAVRKHLAPDGAV